MKHAVVVNACFCGARGFLPFADILFSINEKHVNLMKMKWLLENICLKNTKANTAN